MAKRKKKGKKIEVTKIEVTKIEVIVLEADFSHYEKCKIFKF